jgi:PAS domain S-box-containing protein
MHNTEQASGELIELRRRVAALERELHDGRQDAPRAGGSSLDQAALQESETRFRQMAENIRDVFFLADPITWQVFYISPAFEEIWGRSVDDLYQNPRCWLEPIAPEDMPRVQASVEATIRGERTSFEYRLRRPDGSIRWVRNRNFPVFDSNGRFVRIAGIVEDITGRKQSEEQLLQSEEFHRVLSELTLDYAYSCTVSADQAIRMESVTDGFSRVTGYTLEECNAVGGWQALIHPDDLAALGPRLARIFLGQRDVQEIRICTKDGQVRWIRYSTHPIVDPQQGRVVRLIGAVQDITEERQGDDERRQYARKLQVLSRRLLEVQEEERRHLARELHDEIGQLLTGLQLSLELSARPAAPVPLDEARRLVRDLTGRVRDLSLRLRPTMLDDLGLRPALLWHFDRYRAQTQVQVDLDATGVDRRFPPPVETAAYRIVQEALTNVARHSGARRATVRVWQENGTLFLQVSDAGAGFELGRARQGTSGLSGMHERALLLGGSLTVESRPGLGTRLTAALPVADETGEDTEEQEGAECL